MVDNADFWILRYFLSGWLPAFFFSRWHGSSLLIFDYMIAGMNGSIHCLMFLLGRGCNILKCTKRALGSSDFKRYARACVRKKGN